MAVWSDADPIADHRALDEGGMDLATVADGAVFDDGARSDVAILSNHHMTLQLCTRSKGGISSHHCIRRDNHSICTIEVYTIFQKSVNLNFVGDFI